MTKAWKYVLIVSLALLVCGVLAGGAGLLTGASPERALAALDLEARFGALLAALRRLGVTYGFTI